jgi:predicted dehydrogenase
MFRNDKDDLKMKILIAGLGAIGQRHLRNLNTLLGAQAEILAYRVRGNPEVFTDTLQIEAGTNLETKYNLQVFRDFDQALRQKPEAVFICTPSSLHIPLAIKAARAGCHLFIEKPLSHNYVQINDLIDLAKERNIKVVLGYQMRFHPCLLHLRSLLQHQVIGRVLSVRAEVGEYLPGWHTYEDYRTTYGSRQDLGGGAILSQIHEMDYLFWLFGLPRRVFALGGHLSSLEIDVEDMVEILMEYSIDGHTLPVSLHLDYLQSPPSRTCQVIGDSGKILMDLRALKMTLYDGNGKQIESTSYEGCERNQLFLDELKNFLECLQGHEASVVSLLEGAQSLRMALAAKESLATGKVVIF